MNKEMKQHLETVVTSIVNEDTKTAKLAFHEYLRLKTQNILSEKKDDEDEGSGEEGSGSGEDESSGEDGSGSGDDGSEDKKDTKKKKGNPFAKKED